MKNTFTVLVFYILVFSCQEIDSSRVVVNKSDFKDVIVESKSIGLDTLLKFPESITKSPYDNSFYIYDEAAEIPVIRFDEHFNLEGRFGSKGNGLGEIAGYRFLLPPFSNNNDSVYILDLYERKIVSYDKDLVFSRQYRIDNSEIPGRPGIFKRVNDSTAFIEYRDGESLGYFIDLRSGNYRKTDSLFTYPKGLIEQDLSSVTKLSYFNARPEISTERNEIYFPSINGDILQVYDFKGQLKYFFEGPNFFQPEGVEGEVGDFIYSKDSYQGYVPFNYSCGNLLIVGYSGKYEKDQIEGGEYYFSGTQFLVYDLDSRSPLYRLIPSEAVNFSYGYLDCDNKIIYIIDESNLREGWDVFAIDIKGVM